MAGPVHSPHWITPSHSQVDRINFLADVCVGPDAVDFSVWTSSAAWRDWRQTWLNKGGAPSLKHRAQARRRCRARPARADLLDAAARARSDARRPARSTRALTTAAVLL